MGALLDLSDLILAALNALVAMAIAVQLRIARVPFGLPAIALLAFFSLRVASRLIEAPQLPPDPSDEYTGLVVDTLSILVLAYLLSRTRQVVEAFRARQHEAEFRADEYDRAHRHYTQIVRHRLLNPMTVIRGALLTLRDGVAMDEASRRQLCDAAIAATHEIEQASLMPERRDQLEHELDAIPDPRATGR